MIELVVTVAVVAILVGIAIPSYTRLQQRAKFSEARTHLGMIRIGEESYKAEHDVYYNCKKSPRGDSQLNGLSATWVDLGTAGVDAFIDIGYAPQEAVRFNYEVTGVSQTSYFAKANCDLDTDSKVRTYTLSQAGGIPAPSGDDM